MMNDTWPVHACPYCGKCYACGTRCHVSYNEILNGAVVKGATIEHHCNAMSEPVKIVVKENK